MTVIANIQLLALAIAKTLLRTGLGPGAIALGIIARAAKYWSPCAIGKAYRVEGYHYGDFIGTVESIDRDIAQVRVIDPLRPFPPVKNKCPYPECVLEDFHSGDHYKLRVREGVLLAVQWRCAKWIAIEDPQPSSGGRQLASVLIPTNQSQNRATSLPRKVKRYA